MTNEITPAVQLDHGKPLTPEEFQKGLFDYFEDKGIMADLRAHLRAQMIKALKETAIGKELMNKSPDISPKLQAVNLLIAEYLLQKDYHYSLSVFSTEVPLNHMFPAFSDKENLVKFKFSDSDMWDILETLGFLQAHQNARTISNVYRTNSRVSLLNCIIRTANHQQEFDYIKHLISEMRNDKLILDDATSDGVDEFVSFLKQAHLQPETAIKIIELLKIIITKEMKTVHEAKMEEIMVVKKKMECEANSKLDKYKRKLHSIESNYKKERKRLESELERAKCNLRECAQSLQNKYKDISVMEESLKAREKQLINQAELLTEKEKILQKQLEEVVSERMNVKELQNNFEKKSVLQQERVKETEDRSQQTLDNLHLENTLLKHNVKHQQQQIDAIREQNLSYLSRIQELALKTTTLMQQLENSQRRVDELNTLHSRSVPVAPVVVIPNDPVLNRRSTYGIASYSGGGEEGSTISPLTGRHFKNVSFNKELKRKRHQYPIPIEQSSSSDDFSPTDTILKEAKERLQNLEKESDQIDKHYDSALNKPSILQDFQQNLENIKNSISKIFNYNSPGTSSTVQNANNVGFKSVSSGEDPAVGFRRTSFINTDNAGSKETATNDAEKRELNITKEGLRISAEVMEQLDSLHLQNPNPARDKNDVQKIKSLISDFPDDMKRQDFEEMYNSFSMHEKALSMPSLNSSGLLLGTSFSTVEVSTDCKTDDTPRSQARPNGRRSSGLIVDHVALSCLFAFMLELYLLK